MIQKYTVIEGIEDPHTWIVGTLADDQQIPITFRRFTIVGRLSSYV